MNFNNIKAGLRVVGSTIVKHSPEILMGLGAVSFVGTVIVASKETVKAQDILIDHEDELLYLESCYDMNELDEKAYKKSRRGVYFNTGKLMVKNYIPAVTFGAVTMASFFGAFGIMKKRYATLLVAYSALEESFRTYRQRVIEDKGLDADIYYLTGAKPKEITVKDDEGNKKKVTSLTLPNGAIASPYVIKFSKYNENGERNIQWNNSESLNYSYVKGQIEYMNDIIWQRTVFDDNGNVKIRGSFLLNEARELLGESINDTGAVVGWRLSNGEYGCNGYIKCNFIEAKETIYDPEVGEEVELPCIFWDPNVDGMIYDLIGKKEDKPFKLQRDVYGEELLV